MIEKIGYCDLKEILRKDDIHMDKKTICPGCGKEMPANVTACPYCFYQLPVSFEKSIKKPGYSKKKKIGIAMVAIGVIFAFLSFATRFMGKYDYYGGIINVYENNTSMYGGLKQQMLEGAGSHADDYFQSSFKNLADNYGSLMFDAQNGIDTYQEKQRAIVIVAVVLLVISLGFIGTGVYFIKKNT